MIGQQGVRQFVRAGQPAQPLDGAKRTLQPGKADQRERRLEPPAEQRVPGYVEAHRPAAVADQPVLVVVGADRDARPTGQAQQVEAIIGQ